MTDISPYLTFSAKQMCWHWFHLSRHQHEFESQQLVLNTCSKYLTFHPFWGFDNQAAGSQRSNNTMQPLRRLCNINYICYNKLQFQSRAGHKRTLWGSCALSTGAYLQFKQKSDQIWYQADENRVRDLRTITALVVCHCSTNDIVIDAI